MIPFLAMGTDQLAKRAVGEPGTGDNKKFDGDDGTEKENDSVNNKFHNLISNDLNNPDQFLKNTSIELKYYRYK